MRTICLLLATIVASWSTPIAMGKATLGVELAAVKDLDERQVAVWMKQAATVPFVGGKKK